MMPKLALFVSLFAFAGVAAADCGAAHSEKDAKASAAVLASQAPATKVPASTSTVAAKRGPACTGANCDVVAKQAGSAGAPKSATEATDKEKVVLVSQPAR
jgi:hypothetical protein